jgi:dTDP-4-dehydrorhamnose 3,5-epimerase
MTEDFNPIKVTPLSIPDVLLIEPKIFKDGRGLFFESFNQSAFNAATKTNIHFVQDNQAESVKDVLRGLHYQKTPMAQAKLVRVTEGEVFDVLVDLRRGSSTFGQWLSTILSKDNQRQLFIPEGFAHGYLTLSDRATVLYKASQFYSPAHEGSIRWDDRTLNIDWPKADRLMVSIKDSKAISFDRSKTYFI